MIIFISLTLLGLFGSPGSAQAIPFNASDLCFRYYGSISGYADLYGLNGAEYALNQMNYNSTVYCPSSWAFPDQPGAVLDICPPYYVDDRLNGTLLQIQFRFSKSSDLPMNHLFLRDFLVTDGSIPGQLAETEVRPAIFEGLSESRRDDK
ncbi:uncharacterized protein BDV17DRAFT_288892 [Aspergillus undulatus]|uniref:uncharacterized protein n=1 Tax=Aspergillus undulatus TaxID=1810928 RepID=UPI003CCCEF5F